MRNVKRLAIPRVLAENADAWTRELLAELGKGKRADKKKIKTLQERYAHPEIKKTLRKMYKFCCYCESRVRHVTVDHIEHRKPKAKDKFPECTFEWDNLHLACPKCNRAKLDKWNSRYPVLDAVINNPISQFLTYRRWNRVYLKKRGKTTRDHTDLNRHELLEAREEIYHKIMGIIEIYNNDPDSPDAQIVPQRLEKLSEDQFGSFVKYLKETWLLKNNNG